MELTNVIAGELIQGLWLEPLLRKSIEVEVFLVEIERNWMMLLKQYIVNRLLPDNPNVAKKV